MLAQTYDLNNEVKLHDFIQVVDKKDAVHVKVCVLKMRITT